MIREGIPGAEVKSLHNLNEDDLKFLADCSDLSRPESESLQSIIEKVRERLNDLYFIKLNFPDADLAAIKEKFKAAGDTSLVAKYLLENKEMDEITSNLTALRSKLELYAKK